MAQVLILGSNGQDGSYLAEIQLARGNTVIGVARQETSRWVSAPGFRHVPLDLRDPQALDYLLEEVRPDLIFPLAVIHGAAGFRYEEVWQDALRVNIGAVHVCLEHLRRRAPEARLMAASSLKAFGPVAPPVIDETTPRVSGCLYSITKNAVSDLIACYRKRHGVAASVVYLFNHDSPRRDGSYFLPRLVAQLAARLEGRSPPDPVGSVNFVCDWGSAREFMEIASDLIEAAPRDDHVIASGSTLTAFSVIEILSQAAGLPWQRWLGVRTPPGGAITGHYRAQLDRLRTTLGRVPRQDGIDVALWILREQYGIALSRPPFPQFTADSP